MAKPWIEGDPVAVVDRELIAADAKTGLYYPHYKGLTGTIFKLYDDGTATLRIDSETLPKEIRARHDAGTEAMRKKWLDGLSDEARNRLSASEKKFGLRYSILVATTDLVARPKSETAELSAPAKPTVAAIAPPSAQASLALDVPDEPVRKSLAELEAEEQRHLDEVQRRSKGES